MDLTTPLSLAVDAATLVAVVVAVVGLVFNVRATRRQANTQLFLDYTARYERIMESFPDGALAARLDLTGELPPRSEQLALSALRYLNLCSEEYFLWKRGYLDGKVWEVWEAELRRTLQSRLFRREWPKLEREFEATPEFVDFVHEAQRVRGGSTGNTAVTASG